MEWRVSWVQRRVWDEEGLDCGDVGGDLREESLVESHVRELWRRQRADTERRSEMMSVGWRGEVDVKSSKRLISRVRGLSELSFGEEPFCKDCTTSWMSPDSAIDAAGLRRISPWACNGGWLTIRLYHSQHRS